MANETGRRRFSKYYYVLKDAKEEKETIETPRHFLNRFICAKDFYKDYTFIILGGHGPTGKTWLCKALIENGFNTFEISEDIGGKVQYLDKDNFYSINGFCKQVVIILNHRF